MDEKRDNSVCRRCGRWYRKQNLFEAGCYCPACRKAVTEERRSVRCRGGALAAAFLTTNKPRIRR